MAYAVEARNLTFAYPLSEAGSYGEPVFRNLSFQVAEGSFCLLCGATGSGKTTLLSLMKPEIAPVGRMQGELEVRAEGTGFVFQHPEDQIVCDSVWHELAFGLENAGMEPNEMRRRVAEVAHYFGIEAWMHRRTAELSGGQMQLLNLASIMALRPRLLLLDEPTAQLDPHAQRLFVDLLARIHRDLGVTVIVSTHVPELYETCATDRLLLSELAPLAQAPALGVRKGADDAQPCVCVSDVHVRYGKQDPWVLRGADLNVYPGQVHAIVGGNGCGKSTLLRAIAGVLRPSRGKVTNLMMREQALLPQNPKMLFVCDTVADELHEWHERCGYGGEEERDMAQRFGLDGVLDRHPYDLSGGQLQHLALAKLLLCKPRLLLADEPAKGLDAHAQAHVVRTLRDLAAEGACVVLVTHDVDFARVVADRVSMLFDGQVVCTQSADRFFADNLIYTPHDQSRLFGAMQS